MTLPTFTALNNQTAKLACPDCGSRNTVARVIKVDRVDAQSVPDAKLACLYCGFEWHTPYRLPRSR